MRYRLAASLIALFHIGWVLLIALGAFLSFWYLKAKFFTLGILCITILVRVPWRGKCPLTIWENKFRNLIDKSFDPETGFLARYFKIHLPAKLDHSYRLPLLLGVIVLVAA